MKTFSLLLSFLLVSTLIWAESNKEAESEIKNVTVYRQGAQVERSAVVSLQKGQQTLKLIRNTGSLDKNSIRLSCNNPAVKILSVTSRVEFMENKPVVKESEGIYEKLKQNNREINRLKSRKSVFTDEKELLRMNKDLGGTQNGVQVAELKNAADYYRSRLMEIEFAMLDINEKIDSIELHNSKMKAQLDELNFNKEQIFTSIVAEIESSKPLTAGFQITYFTNDARWQPVYDIRVKEINEPLNINSKAMVSQNTGEDWKDVHLRLSTGEPLNNQSLPELQTWRLGFGRPAVKRVRVEPWTGSLSALRGKVMDRETNEPIPFANVIIEFNGRKVDGATTDFDGNFKILGLAPGTYDVRTSFVGYRTTLTTGVPLKNNRITFVDILLDNMSAQLEEVVIKSYKVPLLDKESSGVTVTSEPIPKTRQNEYVEGVQVDNTMAEFKSIVEYEIDMPYTIPSDDKDYAVNIRDIAIEGIYYYKAVPKYVESAFLICGMDDWEGLDLIPGEADLFYHNTYLGDSYLDTYSTEDTISFSLGADNNVIVKRERIKDFEDEQFIGKNKIKKTGWKITLRNNKSKPIKINVLDQIPVPSYDDIDVELLESSDAKFEKETGILEWETELQPSEVREFTFKYEVKYPKYQTVVLE